ncbi:hypothetical protein TNCV_1249331 [Trichonephila clavipes]|nr:hypothetical protein TNCV_1249331 [Trichonephila clavipes]
MQEDGRSYRVIDRSLQRMDLDVQRNWEQKLLQGSHQRSEDPRKPRCKKALGYGVVTLRVAFQRRLPLNLQHQQNGLE